MNRPPARRRIAVAGGCGGIGRAVVAALLADGQRVAVLDQPEVLERGVPDATELALPIDARDSNSVIGCFDNLKQSWGGLDGLVNLCGFLSAKAPFDDVSDAQWHEDVDGNLTSAFKIARAAADLLRHGTQASAVFVSSGLGVRPLPGYAAYAAGKAGVLALTRQMALELVPTVRVNAVAPGAVQTAFLEGGLGRPKRDPAEQIDPERVAAGIPMGRIAQPEDVAGPILFLLGPASAYMTGQVLHVNGGSYMP